MHFLFLLFIIVPIIEITLLIQVGQAIGAWYTVGLVLLSAFVGVNMLRYQGVATLARAQERMRQGEIPGGEMVEGIVLAVGGALLVTPGFVTDVIGFCCLIPFTRQSLARTLVSRFKVVNVHGGGAQGPFGAGGFDPQGYGDEVEVAPDQDRHPRSSGADYADSPFKKDNKRPGQSGDIIDGDYQRKE